MQTNPVPTPLSTCLPAHAPAAWRAPPRPDLDLGRDAHGAGLARTTPLGSDCDFMALLQGYRRSGGLARASDVVDLLDPGTGTGLARLARWVVERRVIHFEWQAQTWLPWFQFGGPDHTPDPALGAVLSVLARAVLPAATQGDWARAVWFARPHERLADRAPLDVIGVNAGAVLRAAGADAGPLWP